MYNRSTGQRRRTGLRPRALVVACAAAAAACGLLHTRTASARGYSWRDPVTGNWTDETRWTDATAGAPGIPDAPGEHASIRVVSDTGSAFTVSLDAPANIDSLTLDSRDATLAVAAGNTLTIGSATAPSPTFTHSAGTLHFLGDLSFHGDAGTYAFNGGAIAGGAVQLHGTSLAFGASPVARQGAFVLHNRTGAMQTIDGDVPSGVDVTVRAHDFRLNTTGNITNAGRLTFEESGPGLFIVDVGSVGGTLHNTGALTMSRTSPSAWPPGGVSWWLTGALSNGPTGKVHIGNHLRVFGAITNEGNFTIAPNRLLRSDAPSSAPLPVFNQNAGTLDVQGAMEFANVQFNFAGGTITGNPISAADLRLHNTSPGPGSGTFIVSNSFYGSIAEGQTVILRRNADSRGGNVSGNNNWRNDGTLVLEDTVTLTSADGRTGRMENAGVIRIEQNSQQARLIEGELINRETGRISIAATTVARGRIANYGTLDVTDQLDTRGGLLNYGTLSVADGAVWVLSSAFRYEQRGTLALAPMATIDLRGTLAHPYTDPAAGEAALREYERLIASSRNSPSGKWRGPGIYSFNVWAGVPHRTIGAAMRPFGFTHEVAIKETYNGDANLDGRVNADDYFHIDQGFLAQPSDPLFSQGDFNYDGKINADDYFLIDQAFLDQAAPLGSSPGLLSAAAVPEPGLAIAALTGAYLLPQRRRR